MANSQDGTPEFDPTQNSSVNPDSSPAAFDLDSIPEGIKHAAMNMSHEDIHASDLSPDNKKSMSFLKEYLNRNSSPEKESNPVAQDVANPVQLSQPQKIYQQELEKITADPASINLSDSDRHAVALKQTQQALSNNAANAEQGKQELANVNNQIATYNQSGITPPQELLDKKNHLAPQVNSVQAAGSSPNATAPDLSGKYGNQAPDPMEIANGAMLESNNNRADANNEMMQGDLNEVYAKSSRDQAAFHQAQTAKLQFDQQVQQQNDFNDNLNTDYQARQQENQRLISENAQDKINPEAYWDNHSKVLSGIGIALGGIGQGLMHSNTNQVLAQVDNQIHLNVDSQVKTMSNKLESLKSIQNGNYFDMQTALKTQEMKSSLTLQQYNNAIKVSEMYAATTTNPMAAAAAQKIVGVYKDRAAQMQQQLAMNLRGQSLVSQSKERAIPPGFLTPEQDKLHVQVIDPTSGRLIAGGIAATPEAAQKIRDAGQAFSESNNLYNSIDNLRKTLSSKNPMSEEYGRAKVQAVKGIGDMRTSVLNANRFNETELKMLDGLKVDPTRLLQFPSSLVGKIKQLKEDNDFKFKNVISSQGGGNVKYHGYNKLPAQ